jgi:hypothetical protein
MPCTRSRPKHCKKRNLSESRRFVNIRMRLRLRPLRTGLELAQSTKTGQPHSLGRYRLANRGQSRSIAPNRAKIKQENCNVNDMSEKSAGNGLGPAQSTALFLVVLPSFSERTVGKIGTVLILASRLDCLCRACVMTLGRL